MANNAFQDLINGLIAVNNYRMQTTIDQAHKETGVEIRGFITQESTSNLLEDIKWIKGRGYASDKKKSRMVDEVRDHHKQAVGLYSDSIKEKIRVVRENIKLTEEEKKKYIESIRDLLKRCDNRIIGLLSKFLE